MRFLIRMMRTTTSGALSQIARTIMMMRMTMMMRTMTRTTMRTAPMRVRMTVTRTAVRLTMRHTCGTEPSFIVIMTAWIWKTMMMMMTKIMSLRVRMRKKIRMIHMSQNLKRRLVRTMTRSLTKPSSTRLWRFLTWEDRGCPAREVEVAAAVTSPLLAAAVEVVTRPLLTVAIGQLPLALVPRRAKPPRLATTLAPAEVRLLATVHLRRYKSMYPLAYRLRISRRA
mmetsp:Transcript_28772/g.48537  ORF Transcript_28772/g.48537 Transcript_28772/m.48537 type:complete len:226 (+) Transcript_28772:964-1641(+)